MPHLENMTSKICTGCSACRAVCPTNAIELVRDREGFLIPKIIKNKCVDCGKCSAVCQALTELDKPNYDNIAFAVRYKDDQIRKKSASGAYFQAIARYFISKGGYVCGCVLRNMKVVHIVSNQITDLSRMADSKYVQSDMQNCFREIGSLLKQGYPVLFSGTSCQAAGLKMYLSSRRINTDSLVCIDFFCHGVPSPLIWDEYLKYYEKKKRKRPTDYRWRCKDYGWGKSARNANYLNTLVCENKSDRSLLARSWKRIFFDNIVLRQNCHQCKYCTVDKPADITMGDFWKLHEIIPDFDDAKGTSLVIVHNKEHLKFVTEIPDLECIEVNVDESIKGQLNAFQPSKPHDKREEFWNDYLNNGFEYAFRKHIYTNKYIVKSTIKWILFKLGLHNL